MFEKTIRVGGQCYDINYRGTPQAQGPNILVATHFDEDSLVPFLREYGLDDLVPISRTHIWATNSPSDPGSKLTPTQFALLSVSKMTNSTSPEVNKDFYFKAVIRYIKLHKEMFGLYEGDLMQRPTPEVMHRVRGTILDFLQRENLVGMIPILQTTHTLDGYGHLDEIGALYGLIWNNPRLVLTMAFIAINQDTEPFSLFSLKHGFESVWKTIAEKEKLNVQFHTDIVSIHRKKNSVYLKTWQNFKPKTEVCNFLIWTPEPSELLKTLYNPSKEEKHLLGSLEPDIYHAQLINLEGGVRNGPHTVFIANVVSKEEYGVTGITDIAGVLTPGIKTPEGMAKYDNEMGLRTVYAIHAPSKRYISEESLKRKARDHFTKGFNVTNIEFLNTKAWTYLPR